jgi:hypothetical protein
MLILFGKIVAMLHVLLRSDDAWECEFDMNCKTSFLDYHHKESRQWFEVLCENEGITVKGILDLSAMRKLSLDQIKKTMTLSDGDSSCVVKMDAIFVRPNYVYIVTEPQHDEKILTLISKCVIHAITHPNN